MSSYDDYTGLYKAVTVLDAYIDEEAPAVYKHNPLAQDWGRIAKLMEEVGEVADAYIGATGQNPRKGIYGSMDDVLKELADVAFTAICAIQHFTKNPTQTKDTMERRARELKGRIPQ